MVHSRSIKAIFLSAFSTVEALFAMTLFMFFGTFLIGALTYSVSTTKFPNIRKTALEYSAEGLEIVRYIRKNSLTNLPDGTYGLAKSGNEWVLSASPETVATGFSRTITITTPATNTRVVTSRVTWTAGTRSGTETLSSELTNWQDTIANLPWQNPTGPFAYNLSGAADVQQLLYYNNYLYAFLRSSATASSVQPIDVSAYPTYTPRTALPLTTAGLINDATMGSSNNRIYVGTNVSTAELRAVNITNPLAVSIYGSSNLGSNPQAYGIKVSGTTLFIARDAGSRDLEIVTDNNNGTFTPRGVLNASSAFYDVAVNGIYLYASTGNATADILIANVSDITKPANIGSINTTSAAGSSQLEMIGTNLYIFTDDVGMLIYDCTTPTAPVLRGSFPTSGAINAYAYAYDATLQLMFLATANATRELQIVDVSNPASPTLRYSYDSAIPFISLALDSVNNRLYAGSSDDTADITVFIK